MRICRETKWLCENAKTLEQYSGQWVVFSAQSGLMGRAGSATTALKSFRHVKSKDAPFLFHVPAKEEFFSPIHVAAKK